MSQIRNNVQQSGGIERHPRSEFLERFVARHGTALLGAARKYSARADDADDAYQRAAEILLLKAPETDDEQYLLAWALTVVRNEALAIHRRGSQDSPCPPDELVEIRESTSRLPDEQVINAERIRQGHEALRGIKPDHMRCLLLRAEGFGYDEIAAKTGFSYTKVNRYLSEGRAAFRERVERIESGAECRRLAGVLSMLADGVEPRELARDARRHIDNCMACQATLREYRAVPARVAAFAPLAALVPAVTDGSGDRAMAFVRQIADAFQSAIGSLQERAGSFAAGAGSGAEMAFAKKAVIVTAVSASLVAGGVTVEYVATPDEQPAAGQPTGTTGATSRSTGPSPAEPAPDAREAAAADEDRRPPREARQSDVVGEKSVTQVPEAGAPPASLSDSVDGPEQFDAPPPGSLDSGGSSNPGSDLAP